MVSFTGTPKNNDDIHWTFTGRRGHGKTYANELFAEYLREKEDKNIIDVEPVAINDKRLLKDKNK